MTVLVPATGSRFRPGQVWRYRTRPGEEGSRAIVGRVDQTAQGHVIVHVQLDGLAIRNPHVESGRSTLIGHAPVSEAAFAESVTELLEKDALLDGFEDGYATWLEGFLEGKAGVFAVPLAEIPAFIEGALNQGE